MSLDWLRSPVVCDGAVVGDSLDPANVGDTHLVEACRRMYAVMATIERPTCEERLLPLDLFDRIDDLANRLSHGPPPRWVEWAEVVSKFGTYYELHGVGPIAVDREDWETAAKWIPAPPVAGGEVFL